MTTQRSLFAELDEMTDRIKPTRPPFVSPMRRAEAELKARHAVSLEQNERDWQGTGFPTVAQQQTLRAAHPACLLLFRIGDFYELFGEDARTTAKLIGLTLTTRTAKGQDDLPMTGFPYHQLDNYLRKLIHSGQRVAICQTPAA